jgi:hypothetical protein
MPDTTTPANNVGDFEIITLEALSLALQNTVSQRQQDWIAAEAVTITAVTQILGTITSTPADTRGNAANPLPEWLIHHSPERRNSPEAAAKPALAEKVDLAIADSEEMALKFVAQSVALSVEDAANYLRNLRIICTAAIGRFLAQIENTGEGKGALEEIQSAQEILAKAAEDFQRVYKEAATFLEQRSQSGKSAVTDSGERQANLGTGHKTAELSEAAIQALAQAIRNAVTTQQQMNVTAQASTTMGLATLYSIPTGATGMAEKKALQDGAHQAAQN